MFCRSEGDQLARELGVPMLHTSVKTDTNAITFFIKIITITLVIILITFPIILNTIPHPPHHQVKTDTNVGEVFQSLASAHLNRNRDQVEVDQVSTTLHGGQHGGQDLKQKSFYE